MFIANELTSGESRDRIENNLISSKAARDLAASYEDESQQVKAVKEAVESAQVQGKSTVTNKEINAQQKEEKEAKTISEALRKVWAYMDGGVMINVDELAKLLDKTGSLSQAMRQYKKTAK